MSSSRFKYFVPRCLFFQWGSVCWISTCTMPGWDKKCIQNFREEVTSKFIGLNGRIILRGIWMNYNMSTWAELLWRRIGPAEGYCEHCDGTLHFHKSRWLYSPLEPPLASEEELSSVALFSLHFVVLDVPEQNSLLVLSAVAVSYVVVAGAPCLI